MKDELDKLLPCPFCEGKAEWVEDSGALDTPFGLVVDHDEKCFINSWMLVLGDRSDLIAAWNTRAPSAQAERAKALEAALTPDGDTKAAYMGEFKFGIVATVFDEDAEGFTIQSRDVYVPWTTIKEIMAAIQKRALEQTGADHDAG